MGVVVGVLFIVGLMAGMCVLDGLVLQVMWGWFIVPLGLPHIGVAMAVGFGTIVSLMTSTPKAAKDGEEIEELIGQVVNWLIKLVILMAVAWVAHKCM